MADITVTELKQRLDQGEKLIILDVREDDEYRTGNIGAIHIPLGSLMTRQDELMPYKDSEIIVHCRSGKRSASAVQFLQASGFANPRNLAGGILAWKEQVDPGINV
ncbi:MAG: rhodanese-like domain-containing protein [Bacteroidetes bacterium]|nr:rhodanese-like domain-containing protein [Bacteroidota bacterium]